MNTTGTTGENKGLYKFDNNVIRLLGIRYIAEKRYYCYNKIESEEIGVCSNMIPIQLIYLEWADHVE